MKKLLFATVLAIAAAAPFAASAQDEIIIRKHHSYNMPSGGEDWHRDRDRYRDRDNGFRFGVVIGDNGLHRGWRHSRHYGRVCETRYVRHWRHHRRVIEKVTVCRR